MHRTTAAAAAALAFLLAGCADGVDGTDAAGRSAGTSSAQVTAREPASKPSNYPTETEAPAETTAGPKSFPMGYRSTINTDGVGTTLFVTIERPRTVAADEFIKPERGRFLGVTVTYEAAQPDQAFNLFDLVAVTAGGERIPPTVGPSDAGAALSSGTLNSGEKARGVVVFDVPRGGVVGVAYAPIGQVLATWKL